MAPLGETEIARYLARRLGSPVTLRSVKQTFPGVSRETWLIDADIAGARQGFALRLDPPEGSCGTPYGLRREYEVYARLYGSEVPVAEPLWFDEGIDFAEGRPHMVRRLAQGSTAVAGLNEASAAGAALRKRVAFEIMDKLALVHRLDWESLGLGDILPAPSNPAQSLRAEFDIWRGMWDAGHLDADPVLEEALGWLEDVIPQDTPRISLVKGNNGVGEEIWQGDRIVAMSDWELASLGDGVLDLGFSQGTMQLADFGEILRHYEAAVGHEVSPERLAFGGFLIWFKQIVCMKVYMYRPYILGQSRRILCLSFGIHAESTRDRLARCIGRDIVSAWREVVATEGSLYTGFSGARK